MPTTPTRLPTVLFTVDADIAEVMNPTGAGQTWFHDACAGMVP